VVEQKNQFAYKMTVVAAAAPLALPDDGGSTD